jgi:hypothetical protein
MILRHLDVNPIMLSAELEFNPRFEDYLAASARRAKPNSEAPSQTLADLPVGARK